MALAASAFDTAPVALMVMTLDGQCVRVNQALCELLGYPAEQLLGGTYRSIPPPDDLPLDDEAAAILSATGGARRSRSDTGTPMGTRSGHRSLRRSCAIPTGRRSAWSPRSRTSPNTGIGTRSCPGWRCTTP